MTCRTCGRPAENGRPTHWLGCAEAEAPAQPTRRYQESDPGLFCEHHGCSEGKREWSGKGAKPKYCQKHSDPKNRK